MQRIQLETLSPRTLTDKEIVHYVTLYATSQIPAAWVEEVVARFAAIVDKK
jgi:hypothetical protein